MKQSLTPTRRHFSGQKLVVSSWLALVMAIALFIAPASATGVYDLPQLEANSPTWIVDQADVISRANEGALSSQLNKLAESTGQEVRLVIIRRLDYGETIDSFADQVFEQWYPTPETRANQTLLTIDTLTHDTAIRVGDEAKSLLADDIAESVVLETVAVPLRNGSKYNQALLNASDRLVAVLSGQNDPGPPQVQEANIEGTFTSAEETDDANATIWVVVILVLATAIPMATYFWYVGLPGK